MAKNQGNSWLKSINLLLKAINHLALHPLSAYDYDNLIEEIDTQNGKNHDRRR